MTTWTPPQRWCCRHCRLGRSLVPSLTPASLALSYFISFHNYFENIYISIFFSFKHWTEFQGDLHLDKVSFHGLHCRLTIGRYFGWIWESKANPYKNLMARRAGFSIVSERKWEWEFATLGLSFRTQRLIILAPIFVVLNENSFKMSEINRRTISETWPKSLTSIWLMGSFHTCFQCNKIFTRKEQLMINEQRVHGLYISQYSLKVLLISFDVIVLWVYTCASSHKELLSELTKQILGFPIDLVFICPILLNKILGVWVSYFIFPIPLCSWPSACQFQFAYKCILNMNSPQISTMMIRRVMTSTMPMIMMLPVIFYGLLASTTLLQAPWTNGPCHLI